MDNIFPGQKICGRWSGSTYTVLRQLGRGGVGAAYLVSSNGRRYCLKLSDDLMSLTWEYRFMKNNSRKRFLPNAYEFDDFVLNNNVKHYIILEYIEGKNLSEVMKSRQINSMTAVGISLLTAGVFIEFFELGYIYTDLKPENIMLDIKSHSLRLIDMGSLVKTGGMVREYTPKYDRAYWDCGLRRADEGYACFEIMMLAADLLFPIDYGVMSKQDITAVLNRLSGCTIHGVYSLAAKAFSGTADLNAIKEGLSDIYKAERRTDPSRIDNCINISLIAGVIFLMGVIIYGL